MCPYESVEQHGLLDAGYCVDEVWCRGQVRFIEDVYMFVLFSLFVLFVYDIMGLSNRHSPISTHYHFEKTNDAVLWLWDAMNTACSLHPGIATDQLPWSTINIDSYCMPMQGISDGQDLRMENGDHGYDYSLDFPTSSQSAHYKGLYFCRYKHSMAYLTTSFCVLVEEQPTWTCAVYPCPLRYQRNYGP